MLCFNAPKKRVALIQILACLLLTILSFVFCFTPIMKIKLADEQTVNAINSAFEQLELDGDLGEIPENVEISAPKLYGVVGLLVDVIKWSINTANVASNENASAEDIAALAGDLQKTLFDENGKLKDSVKDSLLIVLALTASFSDGMTEGGSSGSNLMGTLLNQVIALIAILALMIVTMLLPLIYGIILLIVLISTLKNLKTPEAAVAKISGKLPRQITIPMTVFLLPCVSPTLSYSTGTLALFLIAVICALMNVVFTRLHGWEKKELRYANIVQGISLLSIIGFVVFFLNIGSTGVFRAFVGGEWTTYLTAVATMTQGNPSITVSSDYMIDALLIMISALLALSSMGYMAKVLQRISLSKKRGSANHIFLAVILLFTAILPMLVMSFEHNYANYVDATGGATSFLVLSAEQNSALTGVLVGLIIMLVSEIALVILTKVFCKDLSKGQRNRVLCDMAYSRKSKKANAVNSDEYEEAALTDDSYDDYE